MAQTHPTQIIRREAGLALALLALWLMVLLVPLHQTAGLLREMGCAGHDISGAWSICVTLADQDGAKDHGVPICPVQGIGKDGLTTPPAPFALALHISLPRDLRPAPHPQAGVRLAVIGLPQPRAPPRLA